MSRLIFRNLPSSLDPTTFKSALTSPPSLSNTTITDTKLVPKRRFAFVGYKTSSEAERVQAWFDGTFGFGGGRIKVEVVRDEPLAPKPAKRIKTQHNETAGAGQPESGPSKRLQEFMDVMKGVDPTQTMTVNADSTANIPGSGRPTGRAQGRTPEGPITQKVPRDTGEGDQGGDDADWLRKRQTITQVDAPEKDGVLSMVQPAQPDEVLILATGRLFLRNLAFVTTSEDLQALFGPFGHLEETHLPRSADGQPLGTAFVLFRHPQDALRSFKELDKTTFQGRLLHILPGRPKPGQEMDVSQILSGDVLGKVKDTHGEVRGKVGKKRKEDAARGVNWATMYMNSDAVAASVADRLGVSKSDLLSASPSDDGGSAAVKLALAETHVIEETKRYFEEAGINLESLQPKVPRSHTVLLVKNIPYGTSIQTITDLFEPHGKLRRVLLPPAGTLGVVEFDDAIEAGRAFKAVSYKRMGNAVVYLEKGPVGMFRHPDKILDTAEDERKRLAEKVAAVAAADHPREQASETDEPNATLFIKNLSFLTTSDRLGALVSSLPGFSFARVQTKPDPKRAGDRLSMGYGFVGFKTRDEAKKAAAGLTGWEVDGKILEVKFAQRGAEAEKEDKKDGKAGGKTKETKVLVKNLAFEVTKKDVKELFSAYGSIKSLRLPLKPTLSSTGSKSTRGFAFVDFTTHAEAQRAMAALKHTHLLGRHLVLQWAGEESVDVEGLREKSGRELRGIVDGDKREKSGKRKFVIGEAGGDGLDA